MFGATSNSNADSSRFLVHTNKSIYSSACKSKILKNNLSKTAATTSLSSQCHQDATQLNSNYVSNRYLQQTTCYCSNSSINANCSCNIGLGDRNLNRSYKADRSLRLSEKSPVFKRNVSTTTTTNASLFNQPVGTSLTTTTSYSNNNSTLNSQTTNKNNNNTKTFLFNKNNLSPSINKRSNNLVRTFV